jgi:hypothetical protein
MTMKRDFAELIEILSEHKCAYELLLSLSRCQKVAFASGGAEGLMKVIARKQAAIDLLCAIDKRLAPYVAEWQATMKALPDQARREVADLTAEISALVGLIKSSELEIEAIVSAAKAVIGRRIRTASKGKQVTKAYGTPALAGTGRYLDRES